MANKINTFILSKDGSPLSFLTSGDGAGKIKYIVDGSSPTSTRADTVRSAAQVAAAKLGVTGIVIPLHGDDLGDNFPDHGVGGANAMTHQASNILGDPAVGDYSLTSGDFFENGVGGAPNAEKDGGAQKFVNAVLDAAYRGYTSGVAQSSGLNSMTVTRGDLSLSNTSITNGTGIVNTYSRSYTVNFKYYQSGVIQNGNDDTAARPDIANDMSDGVPF